MMPTHRLTEYFAERELNDALAYVDYCIRRVYGSGNFKLTHHLSDGVLVFVFEFIDEAEHFVARFFVNPKWSGKEMMRTCAIMVQSLTGLHGRTCPQKKTRKKTPRV